MANLNKVMLIGRLTRDPEVRSFSNGGKVATQLVDTANAIGSGRQLAFPQSAVSEINAVNGALTTASAELGQRAEKLKDNVSFIVDHIRSIKPAGLKGNYFRKVVLSGTMTPGIPLDVQ